MFTYRRQLDTPISRVRFVLGDTTSPGLLTDETIAALLAAAGNERGAAQGAAAGLLAQFATEPDTVRLPNGLSVSFANLRPTWEAVRDGKPGALAALPEPPGSGAGGTANDAESSQGSTRHEVTW